MGLRALERATLLCEPAGTSEVAPPMTASTFPSSPHLISALAREDKALSLADGSEITVLSLPHVDATHRPGVPIQARDVCMTRLAQFLDLRVADRRREEGTG